MWMGVSELCERGPLYRVLQEGHSTHSLSLPTQLLLVKGISQGMHYLSELGYVHKVTNHPIHNYYIGGGLNYSFKFEKQTKTNFSDR